MVVFNQNLDRNNKIYIRKLLRDMGFGKTVAIRLDSRAAVMHPPKADLREIRDSVEVILLDLEKQLERRNKGHQPTELIWMASRTYCTHHSLSLSVCPR